MVIPLILLEPELLCMSHSTMQPNPRALHGLGTACFPSAYSLLQHLEVGLRSVVHSIDVEIFGITHSSAFIIM